MTKQANRERSRSPTNASDEGYANAEGGPRHDESGEEKLTSHDKTLNTGDNYIQ